MPQQSSLFLDVVMVSSVIMSYESKRVDELFSAFILSNVLVNQSQL
jgi:hypothetical protein